MGSLRKNGRLGDPALPSLSSNSFHVKHFHPSSWRARPAAAASQLPASDFCGLGGRLISALVTATFHLFEINASSLPEAFEPLLRD
jgi:hypothetical protein